MRRRANRPCDKRPMTKREALTLVVKLRREKGMALNAYRCKRCRTGTWHLGSFRPRLPEWAWEALREE